MPAPQTNDTRVLSKRTNNALDRLDAVEQALPQILGSLNQTLGQFSQQLNAQGEVVEALVQALGRETVEGIIKDTRERKGQELMEQEKAALEELVSSGAVAKVDKVSEKTIIVGREINPDGTVRSPGRAQVPYARVTTELKEKFLGQTSPFAVDLPNGGKFEVQELFEVVMKPEEPKTESKAAGELS